MNDIVIYAIVGIFVLLILYSIFRNNANVAQRREPDYRERGDEIPRHDDPNIRGSGSFGRPQETRQSDFEWLRDRQGTSVDIPRNPTPTKDSPNVSGQGSFGRDKK